MKLYKDKDNIIYNFPMDVPHDEFIGDKVAITQAEADAIIKERLLSQQQEIISTFSYDKKRLLEYPSIGDQLDALWKGGSAAEEMQATVQEIKNKYPKI